MKLGLSRVGHRNLCVADRAAQMFRRLPAIGKLSGPDEGRHARFHPTRREKIRRADEHVPAHHLGLDPAAQRLLVVKSGYLSPELAPLANPNLMALTDGAVNQDIARLPNRRRRKGTLPFEPTADFSPRAIPSARFPR